MTELDLTLFPIYRLNNQELPALPGLLAMTPPRKVARSREHDRLAVYLVLAGNATLTTAEYLQLTSQTASQFYQASGALTSAMRSAAEALNRTLLDRNLNSTGHGQYAIGWLVLTANRGNNLTLLQSGPTHVNWIGRVATRHIHDPALSGRGLGLSQTATFYLSQIELQPGDRLVFSGKLPATWERMLTTGQRPVALESFRRHLFSLEDGNLNAVLVSVQEGTGKLVIKRSAEHIPGDATSIGAPPAAPSLSPGLPPSDRQDSPSEPVHPGEQPSAYAIASQPEERFPPEIRQVVPEFPASIPRAELQNSAAHPIQEMNGAILSETKDSHEPRPLSPATREAARKLVGGMRAWRRMRDSLSKNLNRFLPNLLPGEESSTPSSTAVMVFIAIMIPLLVVTVGSMMYFRFGRSYQYDNYYIRAETARTQALSSIAPARQRDGWQAVIFYLDKAETYRETPESQSLRQEAQDNLDDLLGIQRLNFSPAFNSGVNAEISRLVANETDLYMLDAERGRVLHAPQSGRYYELDDTFRCGPGEYGGYQVGPIVDILALPRLNSLDAAVLAVDAGGSLLYCAPGQVPQAIPLPLPDTNWGRVTSFTLDGGNLYVLDAPARAIWVYAGNDASFVDRPYFFFGGQIPDIEDSIDLVVNGDDLYLLHADGHLSTCSYSRLETVPTRCQDPATLVNSLPAYEDIDLFAQAHITQILLSMPPDQTLLLLDADNRSVLRLSPRTLELQSQIYPNPETPLKTGAVGAIAINQNRDLFLAVDDQVYFATNVP